MNSDSPALLVVAGEASGDAHGARVLKELQQQCGPVSAFGLGGAQLVQQGLNLIADPSDLNVVGLSEVLGGIRRIISLRNNLLKEIKRRKPKVALLVDLPGFNLHLAKKLKQQGIRVVYYVAPQAWAWRRGRVHKIRRRVDQLCAIFPFEEAFFSRFGIRCEFVGHPLAEAGLEPTNAEASNKIALVPGSRPKEVSRLLPPMLQAAKLLAQQDPTLRFVIPVAPGISKNQLIDLLNQQDLPIQLVSGSAVAALKQARLGLVTSGTATLEAALLGVPIVVVYRVSRSSQMLLRPFFHLKNICIINILLEQQLVPELLQTNVKPSMMVYHAKRLLPDGPERERMSEGFLCLRNKLSGPQPSLRVAQILSQFLIEEAA